MFEKHFDWPQHHLHCKNPLVFVYFQFFIIHSFLQFVAFLLIGVAAAAKNADYIRSVSTVGGIVACGVFLLFIAIVGLYGTVKHHQILLFVYMVVLFSIFVIQFSVACACLAASTDDELNLTERVKLFFKATFQAMVLF